MPDDDAGQSHQISMLRVSASDVALIISPSPKSPPRVTERGLTRGLLPLSIAKRDGEGSDPRSGGGANRAQKQAF